MNDILKKSLTLIKNPKTLFIAGICGIVLIFISSLIPSGEDKAASKASDNSMTVEEYQQSTEESVKKIVERITGDKNATVVVTLDSGIRYSYADAKQTDSSNSSAKESEQSSESVSRSYITVKTADGGEQPLLITEYMPEVRGVAVICRGGDNSSTAEKIENAVTAALNITSKRVYIAGGNDNEKR